MTVKPANVDEYIASFPSDVQKKLKQLRKAVKSCVPKAEEVISYSMPAYKLHGMVLWFAAHEKHIGVYPRAATIAKFQKAISGYKSAKGSVQFPLTEPLPLDLIKEMILYSASLNLQKAGKK